MPGIEIPKDELQKLISTAILQMLTPEKREEMIVLALSNLMEPQSYGGHSRDRPSKLQEAFNDAAMYQAREVFRAELEKPEHKVRFAELVAKSLEKALLIEDLPDKLATVLAKALTGREF